MNGIIHNIAHSPVSFPVLSYWLTCYPLKPDAQTLLKGFRVGFKILYIGLCEFRESKNHRLALQLPEIVMKKFEKELSLGRIVGQF